MRTIKLFVLAALFSALTIMAGGAAAQDASAKIRLVHVIPGVSGLDVYVNGNLSAANLGYGEATTYMDVAAGDLKVRVTLAGVSSALWEQIIPAPAGSAQTLVSSSSDPLTFDVYEDSIGTVGLTTTRFSVIHAVNGGPNVDVIAEGQTIATALAYRTSLNTIDAPANAYTFTVVEEGGSAETPLVPATTFGLAGRTSHMLVLYGPASAPTAMLLKAAVEPSDDAGFVRVVHGAEGAPNVDVLLNGEVVVPGLAFGEASVHIPVEAGTYDVALSVAGGGSEISTLSVEVAAGSATTIAAIGSLDDLVVEAFEDNLSAITPRTAVISLINGISGATVSLALEDGTAVAEGLGFGQISPAIRLDPSRQTLALTVLAGTVEATINIPATSLYGGVYYNLVAVRDSGKFILELYPTSLSQAANSAPGASAELTGNVPTATPVVVGEATAAPQATSSVAQPPTTQPVVPVAPTAPSLPTARVVLDPGANLQLREYPRSDARSLGLAPNGTVFAVNGRAGAPIDILTGDIVFLPDGTEWIDPVTLLTDTDGDGQINGDLEPSETWLNVTLATTDGQVTAWINALYVDIRTPRGEPQLLRDLPTVPQNVAGVSEGSIVATPAPPENFARAVVFNLDPGVALNIRRTPESGGEVLGRMQSGESARLVGFGESGEWAYVEFTPAEGGTVEGWAATLYLRYEFRGRAVDLAEMTSLGLLQPVDETTRRGSVTAGTAPLTQPTADPLRGVNVGTVVGLDAGVSLNLRRTPDTSAEVLAQIPMGANMRVISRSGSDSWLEVEFEGTTGWVAALYTVLSFNSRAINITDIPVSQSFNATATPTSTPEATATPEA